MAISFNSDSLSTGLKKVNPSSFKGLSSKIKTFNINSAISDVTSLIKDKVSSAVNNFKNIKTGAIPELNIPSIDPTAYFEPINIDVEASIASLGDIQNKLNIDSLKKQDLLNNQFNGIDANNISTDELAKFQGDLFKDVQSSVGNISNTQLRDFNVDSLKQQEFINSTAANVVTDAKAAAEKGIGDASQAATQLKSVDSLDSLVDKKNIFI